MSENLALKMPVAEEEGPTYAPGQIEAKVKEKPRSMLAPVLIGLGVVASVGTGVFASYHRADQIRTLEADLEEECSRTARLSRMKCALLTHPGLKECVTDESRAWYLHDAFMESMLDGTLRHADDCENLSDVERKRLKDLF